MKDADDPIPVPTPEDTILLSDAFVVVYRALTPDWQIHEKQLHPAPPYYALEDAKNDPRREPVWLYSGHPHWRTRSMRSSVMVTATKSSLISDELAVAFAA
jgi:hypothetical protein